MSPHPPSPLFRTSRAVVFATVCVALATLGHAMASGSAVPAWAVLAGFAGTFAVTAALAGHERSLATLTGGLLGGQFALHALFVSASAPAASMQHHPASAAGPSGHGSGTAMTLAHIAAAVLSAWWLRRGERAAWSLARRLSAVADRPIRLLLALLAAEPAAPRPRTPVVPAADVPGPAVRVLRHLVVRRGPPARSRALARS
ncbi:MULTISPECIES: MFS transporter [Actinomadura]|uniref:MFS transporter n=1 Tax=Actinomadura yumaensis TaxID=111807 RepID=A0ABW2CXZ0_9ACTN|nr:MFS transporter [Actinomadura sp. J1-007]MWK35497.1 MFS transporter [Actinomadura sp. J1-007]